MAIGWYIDKKLMPIFKKNWLQPIVLIVIGVFVVTTVIGLRQLLLLREQQKDYVISETVWAIGQSELTLLRFRQLVTMYREEPTSFNKEALLLGFDVFWSRIDVLTRGDVKVVAQSFDEYANLISGVKKALNEADSLLQGLTPEKALKIDLILMPFLRPLHSLQVYTIQFVSHKRADFRQKNEGYIVNTGVSFFVVTVLGLFLFGFMYWQRMRNTREIKLRQKIEIELLVAKKLAEDANATKSEFLANMSHELRTPLNAIIGFSDIMTRNMFGPMQNEKYSEYSSDIHSSATHLLELLSNILDISKIESGKFEIIPGSVDVRALCDFCASVVNHSVNSRGHSLTLNMSPDLMPGYIDERHLRQVLLNLLSNAIKYTPENGAITLSAKMENDEIRIDVEDTGLGLTEEEIEQAFVAFAQIRENVAQTHAEGVGLGLAITRKLLNANGARISVKSSKGVGSTFSVFVPIVAQSTEIG